MTDPSLFVEVFPIAEGAVRGLAAYALEMTDSTLPHSAGGKLAYRLRRAFPGHWVWANGKLITDQPRTAIELTITLDGLKTEGDPFKRVAAVLPLERWQPSPHDAAQFVIRALLPDHEDALRKALTGTGLKLQNAIIQRDWRAQPWVIEDFPALSLSVLSYVYYHHLLNKYAQEADDLKTLVGLHVADNTSSMRGEIIAISGPLGEHRARLLELTRRPVMQTLLRKAPDDEPVVRVLSGDNEYEYAASALKIAPRPAEMERFGINPAQASTAQHIKPVLRAQMVRTISDVLKHAGLIGNAFNARQFPDLFLRATFEANLRFANNRVRPYNADTLGTDYQTGGTFRRAKRYDSAPVNIALINALGEVVDDFMEALRRSISKDYGFEINVVRERKVRVVSEKNLQTAVRDVQKEDRDVVLAFFPDSTGEGGDDDASDTYVKQQTVGRGIPALIVHQSTLDRPEAMSSMVMGLLARAGNLPYVLAEPLDYVDFIVGLDIAREEKKSSKSEALTFVSRIYKSDGTLVGYTLHSVSIGMGEAIPLAVMQTLFPAEIFGKARIIVHYAGYLRDDERALFERWRAAAGTQFYLVELASSGAPRLYVSEQRGSKPVIVGAPWGSAFRLSSTEAFLVASRAPADATPQPLHVRTHEPFGIEWAMHSVLAFTFLHYGAMLPPRLPVTVQHSEYIAESVARGVMPDKLFGDTAFWL